MFSSFLFSPQFGRMQVPIQTDFRALIQSARFATRTRRNQMP